MLRIDYRIISMGFVVMYIVRAGVIYLIKIILSDILDENNKKMMINFTFL